MPIETDMKLLTASDVAELCEVDLKTIHNWVERGCIPHFRTPGRHLRFQATDVANFLREWGYAIPRRFYAEVAQTVLVIGSEEVQALVGRAAGQAITVRAVPDLYEAMLRIGAEPTTALILDPKVVEAHTDSIVGIVAAIKRAYPVPVIVLGEDSAKAGDRTELLFVPVGDSKILRAAIVGQVKDATQIEDGFVPPPDSKRRARRMPRVQRPTES